MSGVFGLIKKTIDLLDWDAIYEAIRRVTMKYSVIS